MRRRATDQPDLSKSGLHWEFVFRGTGTTTKAQFAKFLLWLFGAASAGSLVGPPLKEYVQSLFGQ